MDGLLASSETAAETAGSGGSCDGARRSSNSVLRSMAVVLALAGCAADAQSGSVTPPTSITGSQLSAAPQHYDFTGLKSVKFNGEEMTPDAALDAANRSYASLLAQVQPEQNPVAKSVRIVVPDHDRLRPLAAQLLKQPGGAPVEFFAERARLELHGLADGLARSHVFSTATIVEQNDTVAPDPAGADYVVWFQVRSLTPTNAGPWIGRWQVKRAAGAGIEPIGIDTGTPAGVARWESFVKSARLAAMHLNGSTVAASMGSPHRAASNGSGVVLDADGHVVTNNHVVAACPDLRVIDTNGNSTSARLVAGDAANDLALLKTERHWTAWASFRDSRGLRPGDPLVVTGFPLSGLVSSEMAVTTGSLTALAGARGDTRQIEFSAPVQPGNSGGPVLDETGHVVGVTVSMLNSLAVAAATGALPQNVNFAIKSTTVREFLDANQIAVDQGVARPAMSAAAVGALARRFTVKIECWR